MPNELPKVWENVDYVNSSIRTISWGDPGTASMFGTQAQASGETPVQNVSNAMQTGPETALGTDWLTKLLLPETSIPKVQGVLSSTDPAKPPLVDSWKAKLDALTSPAMSRRVAVGIVGLMFAAVGAIGLVGGSTVGALGFGVAANAIEKKVKGGKT